MTITITETVSALRANVGLARLSLSPEWDTLNHDTLRTAAQDLTHAQSSLTVLRYDVDIALLKSLIIAQFPQVSAVKFWVNEDTDYRGALNPAFIQVLDRDDSELPELVPAIRTFIDINVAHSTLAAIFEKHARGEDDVDDVCDPFVLTVLSPAQPTKAFIVVDEDIIAATPAGQTYMPQALVAQFDTLAEAETHIGSLPNIEDVNRGRYGIDGPCNDSGDGQ